MPHRVAAAEFARLSSLYRYGVLDTGPEQAIDAAVGSLAGRLAVPVAQLVFADANRFWSKSGIGPTEPTFPRGGGLIEQVVTGGPAFLAATDGSVAMPPNVLPLRSFAGLRLVGAEDEALGILYVADTRPRDFTEEAAEPLAAAVLEILAVLDSGRRTRDDAGTGALKHDPFVEQARRLVEVSRKGRQWISLVTLDLAPLRAALEAKGPGLGSLVLRHMADLGRTQVRRRDSFGRLDEDLFAVLLTDTGEAGARILAQRLGRHLERGWIDAGLATEGLALGIASMRPSAASDTVEALVRRAAAVRGTPVAVRPASRVA